MNYYERHIGDYLKDTAHLSLLEHGVYTRLLDVYYTRESGIPSSEAARLIGARSRDEKAALAAVLTEFFVLEGDTHTQARADREVERFHGKQAKAKASADARWSAQRSQSERNANASSRPDAPPMRTHSEGNAPSNQTPVSIEETSLLPQAPARQAELAAVPSRPKAPDCPHLAVLALWAEVLPALPQHKPALWRGSRADHLRARWRETSTERSWQTEADGLTFLRKLFGFVGRSAFLTGKSRTTDGRPPFQCELAWLVEPQNWAKVIEGKYHEEKAA